MSVRKEIYANTISVSIGFSKLCLNRIIFYRRKPTSNFSILLIGSFL